MKKMFILVVLLSSILAVSFFTHMQNVPDARESITFFPLDPEASYKNAITTLKLAAISPAKYTLQWTVSSSLDRKAYLRQDMGLLYSNGRMISKTADWVQNTSRLSQDKRLTPRQSALFQAVSFHYSELHKRNGQIFSSQSFSSARLYIIHPDEQMPYSFQQPVNEEENNWKQKLDEQTRTILEHSWNKGIRYYAIPLEEYEAYPLDILQDYAPHSLPGFTKKETDKLIGNLWEGLYKNYYLGIRKKDGTIISPVGSTLPLILLAKNKTNLLVLTETSEGGPVLLKQSIAPD